MYHVYMVNFQLFKGKFPTLKEAKAHAKMLGFECAIFRGNEIVASVKPY